jgi:hypothetical protein
VRSTAISPIRGSSAGQRDQKAFGEEEGDQARAAGSQGGADGRLPGSREPAGQEQVRDVGAGDQQQQTDGDGDRQQDRTELAHQMVEQRHGRGAPPLVGIRPLGGHPLRERRQLLARLLLSDAGAQPADDVEVVAPAIELPLRQGERGPDLGRLLRIGEARRQHAHDLIALAAELDGLAEHGPRGAEAVVPEAVAEQGHLVPSGDLLLGEEGAAERRVHAEQREEAGRALRHVDHLGAVGAGAVENRRKVGRQPLHRLAPLPELAEVAEREAAGRHLPLGILALDQDQARGIGIGKRLEHQSVRDAEDRGAGADSESQGEDAGEGETGAMKQRANGKPEVVQDV